MIVSTYMHIPSKKLLCAKIEETGKRDSGFDVEEREKQEQFSDKRTLS